MRGIFIPDCTQEEIAEILMYARIGANNSMIGVHKHYISVEDTELPRWIPVSERLPEERGYYLVTTDGSHNAVIDIAEYGKFYRKPENEYVLEWNKASRVIAWQPLPEPYKKGGAE